MAVVKKPIDQCEQRIFVVLPPRPRPWRRRARERAGLLRWYVTEIEPMLERTGSPRLALLETEPGENTFPRMPVREGEFAVVRLSRYRDEATMTAVHRRIEQALGRSAAMRRLRTRMVMAPQTLRRQPTPRSSLR